MNPIYPINYKNYTLAEFNSKEHFDNQELVLTPDERDQKTGMYYLCVYGRTVSTFRLKV